RFSRDWSSDVCSSDLICLLEFLFTCLYKWIMWSTEVYIKFWNYRPLVGKENNLSLWCNAFFQMIVVCPPIGGLVFMLICFIINRSEERSVGKGVRFVL